MRILTLVDAGFFAERLSADDQNYLHRTAEAVLDHEPEHHVRLAFPYISAKGERVSLCAGIEKLNFKLSIRNGSRLSDQLIHP